MGGVGTLAVRVGNRDKIKAGFRGEIRLLDSTY